MNFPCWRPLVAIAATWLVGASALASEPTDPDLLLVREVDALAQQIVATGHVPGMAIALTRADKILLSKGYGEREVGSGVRVDSETQFRVASVSKTFTSTLVGLLVERGYASWDDPLPNLVPGFQLKEANAAEALTLEQLLSHRTGLPYHALDRMLEASSSPLDVRAALPNVKLTCLPGDCFGYQNVVFAYAADAVFASSGLFFDTALRRELLIPLGMKNTSIGREELLESGNHALPHVGTPKGQKAVQPKPNYYWLPAAAGVNSSARDMTRWLIAQQGHQPEVLPTEMLRTLHEPRVYTPAETGSSKWRRSRLQAASYGLGFRVFDYQGHPMVFHAGAVEGFRAIFAFAPDTGTGLAMMWNSNSPIPSGLFPTVFDRWFGLDAVDWVEIDKIKVVATSTAATQTGSN